MKKLASLLAVLFLLLTGRVQAEEPAEKFLDALRENGYYDVALLYLDDLNKGNLVGPDFKKEIPFERAKTLIRSTSALRDREKIEQSLDEAQTLLTAYASKNKSLKVSGKTLRFQGNLMYLRANSYLRQSESDRLTAGEKNELLTKARKLLNESLTSYTKARNQIRRLIAGVAECCDWVFCGDSVNRIVPEVLQI